MKKKLHVACSPLTGTIFAGNVLKSGDTWAANKQDVTIEALFAVAEHCVMFGKPVELSKEINETVYPMYRITIEKL